MLRHHHPTQPHALQILYYSPELLKTMMITHLEYAMNYTNQVRWWREGRFCRVLTQPRPLWCAAVPAELCAAPPGLLAASQPAVHVAGGAMGFERACASPYPRCLRCLRCECAGEHAAGGDGVADVDHRRHRAAPGRRFDVASAVLARHPDVVQLPHHPAAVPAVAAVHRRLLRPHRQCDQ